MLSEFEYWYREPGANSSLRCFTNASRPIGRGGWRSDSTNASRNASLLLKSGMPLVWFKSCANVTRAHAPGSCGSRCPTVSRSESAPTRIAAAAAAPLKALATLARRMESWIFGVLPVTTFATPAACKTGCRPRLDDHPDPWRVARPGHKAVDRSIEGLVGPLGRPSLGAFGDRAETAHQNDDHRNRHATDAPVHAAPA